MTAVTAVAEQPALPYLGDPDRTCPYCGTTEANPWLLGNNHWVRTAEEKSAGGYDWTTAHGMCIAQDLTRNHVTHAVRRILARDTCCFRHRTYREECAHAQLARYVARARDLHVDVDDILADLPAVA